VKNAVSGLFDADDEIESIEIVGKNLSSAQESDLLSFLKKCARACDSD
jgi:hypothetical protein